MSVHAYVDDLYKNQKDIEQRIKNAQNAVTFMKNNEGDLFFFNKAYAKLGGIYKLAKRYSDAEKSYRGIIKIYASNPQERENVLNLRQEIDAYCEIGDLCLLQKKKKEAEEAFDEASKLLKRKPVAELAEWYFAQTCMDIADGYYYLHKDDLAEKYYAKLLALLLTKKTKEHKIIAHMCYRIGEISLGQKKWQKSQNYFEKGLKFALTAYEKQKSQYGNNLKTGIYAAEVGAFYNQLKQKNKALDFFQIAHKLLKKYGENQSVLAEKVSQNIKKLKK